MTEPFQTVVGGDELDLGRYAEMSDRLLSSIGVPPDLGRAIDTPVILHGGRRVCDCEQDTGCEACTDFS